jgi:hypothetical protein
MGENIMITGDQFTESVEKLFSFLNADLAFSDVSKKIRNGLFYDIEFKSIDKIISVSYEAREDYLQIILFKLKDGEMPDYDDPKMTIHLDQLNKAIMPLVEPSEITENNNYFASKKASSNIEKQLLKAAKELRLCLRNFDRFE